MPYSMNLPYTRFVRQVSGENKTITGWKTAMNTTFEALKVATWVESTVANDLVGLPLNTPLSFIPSHDFDCFKMSSTVASSGKQICHMGMVAYRFTIPQDANDNDKRITSMLLNLGADKFCVKGLKAVAYFSDTATPPTDWTTCRTGDVATADTTTSGVTHGVLPSLEATLALSQNKNEDVTLAITQASDYAYLYIIVTNWDYEDFRTTREYYIEGSGMLDGGTALFTFDAVSVTADTPVAPALGIPVSTVMNSMATISISTTNPAARLLLSEYIALYPGAYNTIADATADTKVGAWLGADTGTTNAYISGILSKFFVRTRPTALRSLTIALGAETIDLTSLKFSIMCNVWVGTPLILSNDFTQFDSFDATNDADIFCKLATGTGTLTLKVVKATMINPTLSLTNVGQFILEQGKVYTASSVFPINIPNTLGSNLTGIIFLTPYNVRELNAANYETFPLDFTMYIN